MELPVEVYLPLITAYLPFICYFAEYPDPIARCELTHWPEGGGEGTPLYGLYRYVRPQKVWFFSRFGHK